jgi:putative MFS transporter
VVSSTKRAASLAVLVAALGYFVDIYDLILFGMVRRASLLGIGACGDLAATSDACKEILTDKGVFLLNMQMGGMLVGGILWGVLGDKRGRLSVLFGSITLYSIANIANARVDTIEGYAIWRLIAGIGLAGELGAGVTLVSELMGRETRGLGTTIIAAVGVSGGIVAGLVGGAFGVVKVDWRVGDYSGGGLGLALLALRIGVVESGMFKKAALAANVVRGNFFSLFTNRKRFLRYLAVILVGIPVWYVIGIPFTFADAIGGSLGLDPAPDPRSALFFCYGGCSLGGFGCGVLSQKLRSRKRALGIFLAGVVVVLALYFTVGATSHVAFYVLCGAGGFVTGYWAVFVSTAAELFGTNLRATVTTTVPNFVRGSVPLLTTAFEALRHGGAGNVGAAIAVGVGSLALAFVGLATLPETFAVDLDFHETDDAITEAA